MLTFKEIDNVLIPFDKEWNSIAISLSGGADSALLAHILCSMSPKDFVIHIISHTRMWKTRPWQQHDSLKVFQWLSNRHKEIKFFRHTNFVAPDIEYGKNGPILLDEYGKTVSGDNIQIRAFSEYICFQENCDAYFNAVTRNPKDIDLGGMKERDIDSSEHNHHLEFMKHMDKFVCHPFRFVDKSWIFKQYKELDLTDLLNITRSCEGEFPDINYKNYIPGQTVPLCNECFWCKERDWAFKKIFHN